MDIQKKIQSLTGFFSELSFIEETHKYYVNKDKLKYSVSGLIKKFVEDVDFDEIALEQDRKHGLPEGSHKQLWKYNAEAACALGTKVHFFGELYPFARTMKPTNKHEEAIVKFWNDIPGHIIPVKMELQMFHKKYMFAGTADILLYNTKKEAFIIADYKTNKDLFKNFGGQKMTGRFSRLLDTPLNHYQLQLSFYQILLEQTGVKVDSRKIVWLKPDGTYDMYNTKNFTQELNEELESGLAW